jgi:hypothetical protein
MVPKTIFIVPYRDRQAHYEFFSKHIDSLGLIDDETDIYYIHQNDTRPFNRGAVKNIGFLVVRGKYPKDYQNITLVFQDIDSMAREKQNYATVKGKIKHFYGVSHALGGIVSITCGDFEKLNGFPNLWGWGYEDNALQNRAKKANIVVDRSVFFKMKDRENIVRMPEDNFRTVNREDFDAYQKNNEGLRDIHNLTYEFGENGFVHVNGFETRRPPNYSRFQKYDLKNGNNVFDDRMKMSFL